jgi:apolipoprotein N-acyltransferase
MDAPQRGALMLVRFIAVALIGLGVIELSLSWLESSAHHASMRIFDFVLPVILFVLGAAVLIKAGSLAEWISNKLDE